MRVDGHTDVGTEILGVAAANHLVMQPIDSNSDVRHGLANHEGAIGAGNDLMLTSVRVGVGCGD